MKTWQKIISISIVALLVCMAIVFISRNDKDCCLCNSFRYHAPCLIDLESGDLIELDIYFPHETLVAELANPQPEMGTFSFVSLGDVTGTKLTDSKIIELDIPTDSITNPALCKSCRKQLDGLVVSRYVLADLYSSEAKNIIPIKDDLTLDLRCYHITAQLEKDILKLTIQGTRE